MTPTRRRVRMSTYIAQVNTVGANVGAKLLYFNFIFLNVNIVYIGNMNIWYILNYSLLFLTIALIIFSL